MNLLWICGTDEMAVSCFTHHTAWDCPLYVLLNHTCTQKHCWFITSGYCLRMKPAMWFKNVKLHVLLTQVSSSVTMVSMESSSARRCLWLAGTPTLVYHAAGSLVQWRPSSTGAVAMGSQTGIFLISYVSVMHIFCLSVKIVFPLAMRAFPSILSPLFKEGCRKADGTRGMHRKSRRQDPPFSPTALLPQSQAVGLVSCDQIVPTLHKILRPLPYVYNSCIIPPFVLFFTPLLCRHRSFSPPLPSPPFLTSLLHLLFLLYYKGCYTLPLIFLL